MNNLLQKYFVLWLLLPIGVMAAAPPAPDLPEVKHVLDIQHWKTKNGARVYFVAAPEIPMVDISVVFAAGSARDGKHFGTAYVTSQLLSQGTAELSADQIARGFENSGAQYSAQVDRDKSEVHLRSLTEKTYFEPALKLFNQVLTKPNFPESAFAREQKAALHGLKEVQQSPEAIAENAFYSELYHNLPYGHPVLGTTRGLKSLNPQVLQKFYRNYYTAKNSIITVVGALTQDEARAVSEKISSGLRQGKEAAYLPRVAKSKKNRMIHVFFPSKQTHVRMGEIGIRWKDPEALALYVGNNILGGGSTLSRLFTNVREKEGLSYNVYSYFLPLQTNGPFVVGLQTKFEQTINALSVVTQTLRRFLSEGPTEQELKFSQDNLINGLPLRLASNRAINRQLVKIGFYKMRLYYLDEWASRVAALTTTDIRDVFQKQVRMNHLLVVTVGAEQAENMAQILS